MQHSSDHIALSEYFSKWVNVLLPRVNIEVLSVVLCLNPRECKVYIFVLSDEVNLNSLGFIKSQFIFTAVLL